jgi:subtilisin family serine protease
MATPHVAGAAALLRGYDSNLTAESIEDLLTGTSSNNHTISSYSSQDLPIIRSQAPQEIYSELITSETIDSLNPDNLTGTWIGKLSSNSKATNSWRDDDIIKSYGIDYEQLTNNLIAFDFSTSAQNQALIENLFNSNQFDYFESDQIWTIA